MQMNIIHPNGDNENFVLATAPELAALQKAVGGGFIERVPMPELWEETRVMFCNEEGLLNGMEHNAQASALMRDAWLDVADASELVEDMMHLVGPVVILTGTAEEMVEL